MLQIYGKIKKGDSTIIENIPIWFEFKKDPWSGLTEWHGLFKLPNKRNISPGGPYRLILEDGRSGDILLTNIEISSSGKFDVKFQGSGLLKWNKLRNKFKLYNFKKMFDELKAWSSNLEILLNERYKENFFLVESSIEIEKC